MIFGLEENDRRREAVLENYKKKLSSLLAVEGDLSADHVWDLVRTLNGLKPHLDDLGLKVLIEQVTADEDVVRSFYSHLGEEKISLSAERRKQLTIDEIIKEVVS